MSEFIRDPQLNQLIKELNDDGAPVATTPRLRAPSSTVPDDSPLQRILAEMMQRDATDLLLLTGTSPVFRIAGQLVRSEFVPLLEDELRSMFTHYLSEAQGARLEVEGAVDFSLRTLAASGARAARFRINLHRQRGTLAVSVRMLPMAVPSLAELGLPAVLGELVLPTRGLVLVTGPTGSGKTTTLAAMLSEVNRTQARHVITIEDPIEYEHRNDVAVIEQIEVGRDAATFSGALRSALRQDPDVILVGEMRDLETVATALTAAETGHLILSTLHTSDVTQAINRMVDVFPATQQNQVRQQLALSLSAIVCQQLVPRVDSPGRVAAFEILLANYAIRNHIRRDKLQNLYSEITLGRRGGMATMEESLGALVRKGVISMEEARMRANRPDELVG